MNDTNYGQFRISVMVIQVPPVDQGQKAGVGLTGSSWHQVTSMILIMVQSGSHLGNIK